MGKKVQFNLAILNTCKSHTVNWLWIVGF